jgi:hypothetical protein
MALHTCYNERHFTHCKYATDPEPGEFDQLRGVVTFVITMSQLAAPSLSPAQHLTLPYKM